MITQNQAQQLKELGLKQNRHDHARYYINETTIAYFEDIKNAFDAKTWSETKNEVPQDWLSNFSYIPTLEDLIGLVNYNLTLDAAVAQYISVSQTPEEAVKRTEGIIEQAKSKDIVIDQRTLEGIEAIKQRINATQSTPPTI